MSAPWDRTEQLPVTPGANPFRRATLPMPELPLSLHGTWCTACGLEVGLLSHEHYRDFCTVTMQESAYHFCCPGQCELRVAS